MKHSNASQTIATLDARRDCEQIVRLLTTVVFTWDIERSLEFALFRTYAVPSISGLLAVTGEFVKEPLIKSMIPLAFKLFCSQGIFTKA